VYLMEAYGVHSRWFDPMQSYLDWTLGDHVDAAGQEALPNQPLCTGELHFSLFIIGQ